MESSQFLGSLRRMYVLTVILVFLQGYILYYILICSLRYQRKGYFKHLGTNCDEPPPIIRSKSDIPIYYSGKVAPKNGNISLLNTGKMLSYDCPGSSYTPSPLPFFNTKLDYSCSENNIIIVKTGQMVENKNTQAEITTVSYDLILNNYRKKPDTTTTALDQPLGLIGRALGLPQNKEKLEMTLMVLLTFSNDISVYNTSIRSSNSAVNIFIIDNYLTARHYLTCTR